MSHNNLLIIPVCSALPAGLSDNVVKDLMDRFPAVFADKVVLTGNSVVTHSIRITEGYKPPFAYPVTFAYRDRVKVMLDEMLAGGILRPSASRYASPLVVVPKKDGRIRLCVDYRAINKVTIPDSYGLPRISDIKQNVRGTCFSTIDLKDGFWQVTVAAEDVEKTAVATPWGCTNIFGCRLASGMRHPPSNALLIMFCTGFPTWRCILMTSLYILTLWNTTCRS